MKTCTKCYIRKNLIDFYKDKSKKDGHREQCKDCQKKKLYKSNKNWRENNREKVNQCSRKHYELNKERKHKLGKIWRENNRERDSQIRKLYAKNNPHIRRKAVLKYKKNHPEVGRETCRRRQMKQKEAALNWKIYRKEMQEIYRNCPEGYEVDHIIPLQNKNVCGLHVPWNLQYLTAEDNRKKKNTFRLEIEGLHSGV